MTRPGFLQRVFGTQTWPDNHTGEWPDNHTSEVTDDDELGQFSRSTHPDPTPDIRVLITYRGPGMFFPAQAVVAISGLTRARDIWIETDSVFQPACPGAVITQLMICPSFPT